MKITINTKEDSKEEIRKVISLLSTLVKEGITSNSDIFSNNDVFGSSDNTTSDNSSNSSSTDLSSSSNESSSNPNAFVNMFGDATESKEETTIDLASLSDLAQKKEETPEPEEKEEVKVVSY